VVHFAYMENERKFKAGEIPELEELRLVTDTLLTTALREPDNYSGFMVTTFSDRDYAEANFTHTLNPRTRSVFETFTIRREGPDHTIIFQTQRPTHEDEGLGGIVRVTKEYPLAPGRPTSEKKEIGRKKNSGALGDVSLLCPVVTGEPLDSGEQEQLDEIESLIGAMRFIRGEYNEGQPRTRLGWLRWLLQRQQRGTDV